MSMLDDQDEWKAINNCHACGWIGPASDLKIINKSDSWIGDTYWYQNELEVDDASVDFRRVCPRCNK